MIYGELKRPVTFHLIAGIVLSAIIVSVIVLAKYEKSLSDTTKRSGLIRTNALKVEQAVIDTDSAMRKIDGLLPSYYHSRSHKEIMLLALDGIKTAIKGADITVTNFDERGGEIILPVNISIPVDSYLHLVSNIGYLQSMNFPFFAIKNIVIEKAAGKPSDAILCKIEGSLRMPAKKVKE